MKKYKWIVILVNLIVLMVLFNRSIIKKETTLSEGKLVLLKLAPIDPRSLMQGDYMRLSYSIARGQTDSITKRGYCVVKLDANAIAEKVRFQEKLEPLNDNEYLIKYTAGSWDVNIGAESFFFQEGEGEKFEKSEYGALKIDSKGNSILIGLYDEKLKLIE